MKDRILRMKRLGMDSYEIMLETGLTRDNIQKIARKAGEPFGREAKYVCIVCRKRPVSSKRVRTCGLCRRNREAEGPANYKTWGPVYV